MKLVTLSNGTRDGQLHVVSRDGTKVLSVSTTMGLQVAMENWDAIQPELTSLADRVEVEGAAFEPSNALSPFPRAVQWLDGSAFETHALLLQQVWGQPVKGLSGRPLMYQGMSDRFLSPTEVAIFPSVDDGIDFEGEFGVILGDVPMGTKTKDPIRITLRKGRRRPRWLR